MVIKECVVSVTGMEVISEMEVSDARILHCNECCVLRY